MASLELLLPGSRVLLMGRAARGFIDAGLVVHMRLIGDERRRSISEVLENDMEIDSPKWRTVETRLGRLNQVLFHDSGYDFVITRVPTSLSAPHGTDLFRDQAIAAIDLRSLRETIDRHSR